MKTLTFVAFLLVVLFACEADAGSFNLSISLDPGFTIGRGRAHHERRHRARERTEDADTDVDTTELPNARDIKQFEIPRVFTQRSSHHEDEDDDDDNDNDEQVDRHHGGPHRSSHRLG